jgi:hypothetical protein
MAESENPRRFEGVELLLQDGDIITSKKGILFHDPLIDPSKGKGMIVHRLKYEGKGHWQVMESTRYPREFVDTKKIKDLEKLKKRPKVRSNGEDQRAH